MAPRPSPFVVIAHHVGCIGAAISCARKAQPEVRALAGLGLLDDEVAAMHCGDALREEEPEPEPTRSRPREEAIEDVWTDLVRNPWPLVGDIDVHPLAFLLLSTRNVHMDRCAAW